MELAGLVVAIVVIMLVGYVLPQRIARRRAIVSSREGDRFSPQLRVVAGKGETEPKSREKTVHVGSSSHVAGLVASKVVTTHGGGHMSKSVPRRPAIAKSSSRSNGSDMLAAREIASLKAKRSARLSRERAATKRRLVTSLASVFAVVACAIVCAVTVVSWWWLAIPATFLVASLGSSRLTAIQMEKQAKQEDARLAELYDGIAVPVEDEIAAAKESSATVSPAIQKTSSSRAGRLVGETESDAPKTEQSADPVVELDESIGDSSEGVLEGSSDEAERVGAVPVADSLDEDKDAGVDSLETTDDGEKWEVPVVPAPSYAAKGRSARRQVHLDTDLRGVPQVKDQGVVPGRPLEASSADGDDVWQTEEISDGGNFNFDLEAILDARRAQ